MCHNTSNVFKLDLFGDILRLDQIFLRCYENASIAKVFPTALADPLLQNLI